MSGEERRMQMIAEVPDVSTRIQLVFMEMPEIRLTRHQIRRLLNLPIEACEDAVRALLTSGFLTESLEGVLGRGTSTTFRRY
jgi:hypothetical protein